MPLYEIPPHGLIGALRKKRFSKPARLLTLEEWLTERSQDTPLSRKAMLETVAVAIKALQGLYVHLDLKLARRGVDPVRQLSVFRERVANQDARMSARTFHAEMLRIFKSLGDAHTAYRLPPPYKTTIAFLPFVINAFGDPRKKQRTYVVSHLLPEAVGRFTRIHFNHGVEITSWNGTPIEDAVRAATAFEEGSNAPNDFLVALQFMTVRWLGASFDPESPWVVVGYRDQSGANYEARFFWVTLHMPEAEIMVSPQALALIFEPFGCADPFPSARGFERSLHVTSASVHVGRKTLFVKTTEKAQDPGERERLGRDFIRAFFGYVDRDDMRRFTRDHALLRRRRLSDEHPTLLPMFLVAREHTIDDIIANAGMRAPKVVKAAAGLRFGYIGIRGFPPSGFARQLFTYELRRLLNLMPGDGLIIDIRDNPGGSANLAEESLQLITPKRITPLPFRFLATPSTKAITAKGGAFGDYSESVSTALSTGGRFSAGLSLTPARHANEVGQHYFGPVILLTNGATYSAADIFAAGFEDHALGPVIGVDETTGGGGANCWFYNDDVMIFLPGADPLKHGINLQIAVRQCSRVGTNNEGVLIEEVGVPPKYDTSLTRKDVLEPRPWPLLFFAASKLIEAAGKRRYDLATSLINRGGERRVAVRTVNIDRLDFFVNGRPTSRTVDRTSKAPIESPVLPTDDTVELEIRGFARSELVARYVQAFPFVDPPATEADDASPRNPREARQWRQARLARSKDGRR
jgi:C-terminal processing protease CtpA/Prc